MAAKLTAITPSGLVRADRRWRGGYRNCLRRSNGHNSRLRFRPDDGVHSRLSSRRQPGVRPLGCNAGTCHGANKGKNGLSFSLRGIDAILDVRSFLDDQRRPPRQYRLAG